MGPDSDPDPDLGPDTSPTPDTSPMPDPGVNPDVNPDQDTVPPEPAPPTETKPGTYPTGPQPTTPEPKIDPQEQLEGIRKAQDAAKKNRPSINDEDDDWDGVRSRPKQNKIRSIQKSVDRDQNDFDR